MPERTIRTSRVTGIRMDPILSAALVAELVTPSDQMWLVSAWVSDVAAIDNRSGSYDGLLVDASARVYSLAEVLATLTKRHTRLTVVTRPVEHNGPFLERLGRLADPSRLTVIQHPDVHEKTLCGGDWLLDGSMNFTIRGMEVNDESVTYRLDQARAAQARIDFAHRWKGQQ